MTITPRLVAPRPEGRLPCRPVAASVLALLVGSACGGGDVTGPPTGPVPVATVMVVPGTLALAPGDGGTLTAELRGNGGVLLSGRAVAWGSSDVTVATVSTQGGVTAVGVGSATISAASEGRSGSAQVAVAWPPADTVVVAPAALSLPVGQTGALAAEARRRTGQLIPGKVFTWVSGNPLVASVSASGVVTALSPGTTTLTAAVDARIGSAAVTVVPGPVASVTVTPAAGTLPVTTTLQLTAVAKDAGGFAVPGGAVTWASTNAALATVSPAGLVTGVAPGGPVTVTAMVAGKSGAAAITVVPGAVATAEVTPTATTLQLTQTVQLTVVAKDAQGNAVPGRPITWVSAFPLIASVSTGGLVTGILAGGPVTISALIDGKMGTAAVTVTPVPVATVEVSPSATTVAMGATRQLTAVVKDAGGTVLVGRAVTWASANAALATVSPTGLVTGVAPGGPVNVTATAEGRSAASAVTVTPVYYSLTTVRSDGVAGTPTAGTTPYLVGSPVAYAFTAQSTHEHLRVEVDGTGAATSGTLTMDRNRTVTALADQRVTVSPAVEPDVSGLATTLHGLVTGATRPMDAYRAAEATAATLAGRGLSPDSIDRALRVARLRAYTTADAMAVAAALREIEDSLAAVASLSPQTGPRRTDGPSTPEVVYLYINGINTTADGNQTTYIHYLDPVVRAAGYTDLSQYKVRRFYNPTGNLDAEDFGAVVCAQRAADALAEGAAPTWDLSCNSLFLLAFGGNDILESYSQVLSRTLVRPVSTPVARRLADSIAATAAGSRVVLVAHSQGNLMTHEAYRELERRGGVNAQCIGTVSLAPPLPITLLAGGHPVNQRHVAGTSVKDLLLEVERLRPGAMPGIGTVPTNANSLSTFADASHAQASGMWSSVVAGVVRLLLGLDLHLINSDYLTANRPVTMAALQDQTNRVLRNCAAALAFNTPPGNGQVATPLPAFEVQVLGPNGQPATQATVPVTLQLGNNPGTATLGGTLTVNAVNGVARFTNVTVSQPGIGYTLRASAQGAPTATSAPFQVAAAPAVTLEWVNWNIISAPVGSNVAVTVRLRNEFSQPLAGVPAVFNVTGGGGTFQPWGTNNATIWTDAQGLASVTWQVGPTPGTNNNTVSVAVTGAQPGAILFQVSGTAIPPGVVRFIAKGNGNANCAVTTSNQAYCWGRDGGSGQLGLDPPRDIPTPAAVSGGLPFAQIVIGTRHTCGRTTTGAAYCWGAGGLGTGIDGNNQSNTPVLVVGGQTWVDLAAGDGTTCGLNTSGAAYCWGGTGFLLGDYVWNASPFPLPGGLSFISIVVGGAHACGLTAASVTYCWGQNRFGQLGNGTVDANPYQTPVGWSVASYPPAPVSGPAFVEISGGGQSVCGRTAANATYCWGWNILGQLGDGTTIDRPSPTRVSGPDFVQVSVGSEHSCGRTAAGAVYCWGGNLYGRLGDGTTTNRLVPTLVQGGPFIDVAAGSATSCARTATNQLYCWGASWLVGVPSLVDVLTPTLVTLP